MTSFLRFNKNMLKKVIFRNLQSLWNNIRVFAFWTHTLYLIFNWAVIKKELQCTFQSMIKREFVLSFLSFEIVEISALDILNNEVHTIKQINVYTKLAGLFLALTWA